MNEKPTWWDYFTTSFVLLIIIVWAVYEYKADPNKIPFEPIVGVISYLFVLWGFARVKHVLSNKQNNKQEQNAKSIFNIDNINNAKFSVFVNGGRTIAFVALFAIAIWQKNEISDLLGFNCFFKANDQNFKILVLPFRQICVQNGQNYDAGLVVTERLNDIIYKEKLKIKTFYWWDYNFKDFNYETAKKLRKYHNADMIIFGAYQTDACSGEGNQVCINYITDEKWKIGEFGTKLGSDYQKGGVEELKTGKLQEKIENLATIISLIAQVKSIDHTTYLQKLNKILLDENFSNSSQASIYIEIADKLIEEGKLDEPLTQYEKALKIYLFNNNKNNAAVCYKRLGSTHTTLGNLDKALEFYELGYQLEKELYDRNPKNEEFKNGLAISYEKLGSTHTALGNLEKALGLYEEMNKLFKELYAAYPNNVSFKYGLAISYSKLGSTHTALGNLEKALDLYEEDIKLSKELYAAYPNNVSFKNGLSISYERLGSTHTALGNLEKALGLYEDYNLLKKELYAAYPNNVSFKNGLAISYKKLGSTHTALGNLEKALGLYEEDIKLSKELYAAYPNNVSFKNGLAISYEKLGETHTALGNLDKALGFYEERNRLGKELYAAYPTNVDFKNGLAISYEKLGKTHMALGNLDKALGFYEDDIKLTKELYAAYPTNVDFKNGLALSYQWLGWFFKNKKDNKLKAKEYYNESKKLLLELTTSFPSYVEFQNNLKWVQNALSKMD